MHITFILRVIFLLKIQRLSSFEDKELEKRQLQRSRSGLQSIKSTIDPFVSMATYGHFIFFQTVKEMMSTKLAEEIRSQITDTKTHLQDYYGSRYHVPIKTGTTHLAVLAANGDAVSLTSTVNG